MTTPARRQYLRIKREHQEEILLFRMGDFYEAFDDDAQVVSRVLEIALTSREMGKGQRIPLAGIPYHALDNYLAKLIRKGYKVAICEQTSDPATSRGLVDREVVRVVTPGVVMEDGALDTHSNNYLVSVVFDGEEVGLAYVDITTSEFATTQMPLDQLSVELGRLSPSEILIPKDHDRLSLGVEGVVTAVEPDAFDLDWSQESLLQHFRVASLEPYGCDRSPLAIRSAGAIIDYLNRNQRSALSQLTTMHTYSTASYMVLDQQTVRNLELFEGGRWGDRGTSLYSVLDGTRTAMGGRLLRRWVGQPLLDTGEICRRQDAVEWFYFSAIRRGRVASLLESISDLERLVNKIRVNTAMPRDLVALALSLEAGPHICAILSEIKDGLEITWLAEEIHANEEVVGLIKSGINDDPSSTFGYGKVIKEGFSPELDSLRSSSHMAQEYIAGLERTERERTSIKSLKVGFNKVFGYYIEVSNPNLDRVPKEYVRRQTLVGGERFITPEMKEYESQILNAQERISELEGALFRKICEQVSEHGQSIMATAGAIAEVDCFYSLADVASRYGYVRPRLNDDGVIEISQGRHPVVERTLEPGDFVSNDVQLSNTENQLVVLTGPNMAGKSTYIRQVALITLLTQVGSFVPAESANIGLVDRIFTRVGLQDDLALGQSTFMVEMVETAAILNHATRQSLLVLDEIGRGTSTYDGLAIARAVAEYIHSHPQLGCKTLFATHYHELTKLADVLPRVRNYNIAVSEEQGEIVFLRRILPGGADKSYGVHVARLAGLPGSVINRSWEVLKELEDSFGEHELLSSSDHHGSGARVTPTPLESQQLQMIPAHQPVIESLLGLDVSSITPMEAIIKLYELQNQAKEPEDSDS